MRAIKTAGLFCVGGASYVGLEMLWRGRSHVSMFLAGGTCFLLLGQLNRTKLPLPVRALAGAGVITTVELLAGFMANKGYQVWDYRQMPMNYRGQICLPYSLLWVPVTRMAMGMGKLLEKGGH